MQKRRLKKRFKISLIIILITIAILIGLLLLINRKPKINKIIIGTWITPGGTIYTFNEDNTGTMKVPLNVYSFIYRIEDNKISIDYEDKSAFDPVYECTIKDDKLIFKGENGTFTFNKVITSK